MRDSLPPIRQAPKYVRDFLVRIGGKNPYGDAVFRVVLAETVFQLEAGDWHEWPDDAELADRYGLGLGTLVKMKNSGATARQCREHIEGQLQKTPLRIQAGIKAVRRYPDDMTGWVLEKWLPARFSGSREEWNAQTFQGELRLGPYPERGEYHMVNCFSGKVPSLSRIEEVVRANYFAIENDHRTPVQRAQDRARQRERDKERRHKAVVDKLEALYKDLAPLMNRLSLGAGKVRQELAEAAGLTGHYGN